MKGIFCCFTYLMAALAMVCGTPGQSGAVKTYVPAQPAVGDTIIFGAYEQDNDASDGREAIEWIVLDREDNQLLVVSCYALDCRQYHPEYIDVTWESSDLRAWMNEDFLNEAFDDDEISRITVTEMTSEQAADDSTGADHPAGDRIFLLSGDELERYYTSNDARRCSATAYAAAQGVYCNSDGYCWWWVRSDCTGDVHIAWLVDGRGKIYPNGSLVDETNGIRPAMWIHWDEAERSKAASGDKVLKKNR